LPNYFFSDHHHALSIILFSPIFSFYHSIHQQLTYLYPLCLILCSKLYSKSLLRGSLFSVKL
jgi:hypothetical protein